jgi:hypothetical protein
VCVVITSQTAFNYSFIHRRRRHIRLELECSRQTCQICIKSTRELFKFPNDKRNVKCKEAGSSTNKFQFHPQSSRETPPQC